MSTDASSPAVSTLPVRLTTRSPKYIIPSDAFILPSQWRRFQLSALVNKILDPQGAASPIPFDFVVDGELLQGSLQQWVDERRGGKTEEVLELEFIESVLPPQHLSSYEHDDWISAVSVQREGLFLTSSYDSRLRIFTSSSSASGPSSSAAPIITLSAGAISGGLTSCSWLTPAPSAASDAPVDWLAAGAMDGITRLWSVPHVDASYVLAPGAQPLQATSLMELHHHESPVSSIQASVDGQYILSAGWDSTLAVFPVHHQPEAHDPSVPVPRQLSNRQTKRRKVDPRLADEEDDADVSKGGWRVAPEAVLRGHQARVGAAMWDKSQSDGGKVWSCGWDGSVRGWDVELQVNSVVKQAPSDKVCLSMDQLSPLSSSSTLLLTSHADRTVSLWDARESTSIISLSFPSAHTSHIPVVRAHPTNPNGFFTAGHDGAIKVWDIRSPKQALLGVQRNLKEDKKGKEKLLGGDWDGRIVAVGGESCELEVYQGNM